MILPIVVRTMMMPELVLGQAAMDGDVIMWGVRGQTDPHGSVSEAGWLMRVPLCVRRAGARSGW